MLCRGDEAAGSFTASLQPVRRTDSNACTTGIGGEQRYVLYASSGGAADALAEGGTVELLGRRYYVHSVEPRALRGRTLYYKVVVQACQGEG